MTDSQKSQNKQQRRWAVCRAKVKAGAFSAVVDIDSDSESDPDEGFGDDASRPSMLKASMSFSNHAIGTQPEEGEDSTTQSSCPSTAVTASTADLSVECATPVEGSTRSSAVSPDPIGISLSLSVGRKDQEESSQWELSSSSGESVHSTTRSLTSAQDQATPTHSARGTCPESPGSYVARMQRTLLRMERSGGNANGNIDVNGKANRIANGNANVNANVNPNAYSSVNGQGNGQDCVGSGPTVWLEGNAAGRVDTHAAESTEQGTEESHQRGLDKRPGTHQDNYHEMDLMIAAVSTMIGMYIPEEARYVLLVACCAVIVLIPGRRWGLFDPCLWSASSSSAERDSTSPDQGDSAAPAHGASLSDHRESEGMDAARVESRPPGDVSRDTVGQDVAAGGAAAGGAAAGGAAAGGATAGGAAAGGAAAGGAKVEGAAEVTAEEQGQQYASTKLYEEAQAHGQEINGNRKSREIGVASGSGGEPDVGGVRRAVL